MVNKKYTCGCNNKLITRIPNTNRTVAIGDLHGDLSAAIYTLLVADVIAIITEQEKSSYEYVSVVLTNTRKNTTNIVYIIWVGGSTQVVQVGDQIDRCRYNKDKEDSCIKPFKDDENSDIKILNLYTKIDFLAKKTGGRLISLFGNHEIMNILENDFRYVSPMGSFNHADLSKFDFKYLSSLYNTNKTEYMKKYNEGLKARAQEFNNYYRTYLACTRQSVIIIGGILFVHGGILDFYNNNNTIDNMESINIQVQTQLLINEKLSEDLRSIFWDRHVDNMERDNIRYIEEENNEEDIKCHSNIENYTTNYSYIDRHDIQDIEEDGVENDVENNINDDKYYKAHVVKDIYKNKKKYSNTDSEIHCSIYDEIFNEYNITGLVVGHTVQNKLSAYGINSSCDQRIWRIDIGLSAAFNSCRPNIRRELEVLEINYTSDNKPTFNILSRKYKK